MDLPAPKPPQEVATPIENQPVKQLGSEINPEFLPPVGAAPVAGGSSQQGVMQAPTPVPIPPLPGAPQSVTVPQAGAASDNPVLAEDVDLIEKEWVEKAKAIVNYTKDDPYRQNKEINKMKADYIKKRYNKDIQVSE